jgi:hypothetical protein
VPRYEVTVQARGIALPLAESVAVGFVRLVQVRAQDPLEAGMRAIAHAQAEWSESAHAARNRGGAPRFTIETLGLLTWWHRLLGAPKGYIFFGEDGIHTQSD